MLEFNSVPEKKTNFFLVRCKGEKIFHLSNVDLRMRYTKGKKTYYRYFINSLENKKLLSDIEVEVRNTVLEKNKEWFKNTLTEDDIVERYEPSYDDQTQFLDVLYLDNYPPSIINEGDDITSISVQILGICVNKNSFSVKWVLKSIEKISVDVPMNDIEEEWGERIDKYDKYIDNKVKKLLNVKDKMRELHKNKEWENLSLCVEEIYK